MALASVPKAKLAKGKKVFLVSPTVAPQTLAVLQTRASGFGIEIQVAKSNDSFEKEVEELGEEKLMGSLVQYPDVNGEIRDWESVTQKVKAAGAKTLVTSDLLALTLIKPPGEWGADMVCGSSQRFGMSWHTDSSAALTIRCSRWLRRTPRGLLRLHRRLEAKASRSNRGSQQGLVRRAGLPSRPPE